MPPVSQSESTDPQPNINITTPYVPRTPSPIVSISINHPIATMVKKIKNFLTHRQTLFSTTFTIRITPIVAIVSLFGLATLFGGGVTTAFTFGKTVEEKFFTSLPTPTPQVIVKTPTIVSVSRVGTIKATYQLPSLENQITQNISTSDIPTLRPSDVSEAPSLPSPTPTIPIVHYVLESRGGAITFLQGAAINFQHYLGLRVLITGSFDSTKNILTVGKTGDIEILQ